MVHFRHLDFVWKGSRTREGETKCLASDKISSNCGEKNNLLIYIGVNRTHITASIYPDDAGIKPANCTILNNRCTFPISPVHLPLPSFKIIF